jgi:SAM-dependent methyltransferase
MKNLDQIRRILQFAKANDKSYSGKQFEAGYQTLHIDGVELRGQRDPVQRFENLDYEFTGKSVLDIGSNQGGMLFPLASKISSGMGVDFNPNLVNTANKIAKHSGYDNLDFYVFNLENDPLSLLNDFAVTDRFDIVFFLSLCMWLKNWKEILGWIRMNSDACLLETNGNPREQEDQEKEARRLFSTVELINGSSLDDDIQAKRKLFICRS